MTEPDTMDSFLVPRPEDIDAWIKEHQHYDGQRGVWVLTGYQYIAGGVPFSELTRRGWQYDMQRDAMIWDRGF